MLQIVRRELLLTLVLASSCFGQVITSKGYKINADGSLALSSTKQPGAIVNSDGLTVNPDGSIFTEGTALASSPSKGAGHVGTCTAAAARTCTVLFSTAFTSTPVCTASDVSSITALMVTPSITGVTITILGSSSDTFAYICVGNPN